MKLKYLIPIVLLIFVGLAIICVISLTSLGKYPQLENAIQISGVLVALVTAVIALSVADPKRNKIKIEIEEPSASVKCTYPKDKLSADLKNIYKNFPDPISSYQIHFKMTNKSGFSLKKPVVTFALPLEKQHPDKTCLRRSFNSNLYNSQDELRILEMANTWILSNSNLPYWNNDEDLIIWIRMALNENEAQCFDVEVSVNCDNADGITKKVQINPSKLLCSKS